MVGVLFYHSDKGCTLKSISDPDLRVSINTLILSVVFFFQLSCIKLNIDIPVEPKIFLDYISIVKKTDDMSDYSKPLKDEIITSSDNFVISVIKVRNIGKKLGLIWWWYGPDMNLVKKSDEMIVDRKGIFLEYFVAWNALDKKFFKKRSGKWKVVVKSGEIIIGEKDFLITKNL